MIIKQRRYIKWGEMGGTFMYGTNVTYHSDYHISLYNPLLPSGEVIRSWVSSVNYQAARIQPSLPLLKKNYNYRLRFDMDCRPENGIYIKVIFFDRYGDVVDEKLEKVKEFTFSYPAEAFTYQVSLLSAGFESLEFYSLSIEEINHV